MNVLTDRIVEFIEKYLYWMSVPTVRVTDIIEIIILTVLIYQLFKWVKKTRAWSLFKGFMVILGFMVIAAIFQLNTIVWIFTRLFNVGIIAIVIVFQPELRRALEQLGRKRFFGNFVIENDKNRNDGKLSKRTVNEI
ncbi:MAG: TIGR00159 family protein, partial [Lachnospiraceae bacterium]|nr:TIGR00159 family protein [Lachnospiraceae bacterium]